MITAGWRSGFTRQSAKLDTQVQFLYRPPRLGAVAQLVEQRTHIPRVVGSIPTSTTKYYSTFRIGRASTQK